MRTIKMNYVDPAGADASPIEISFDPAKFANLPRYTDDVQVVEGLQRFAKGLPKTVTHRHSRVIMPNGSVTPVIFNYHFGARKDRPRTYFAWATLHWCDARHLSGVRISVDVKSMPGEKKGEMLVRLFDEFEDAVRAVWDANREAGRCIHRILGSEYSTIVDETTGKRVTITRRTVRGEIAA